ncbi:MAG: hypothetical protein COS99_06485 [Candidatus Omnitrophica bacterium CG07_land_8_20_14_0_80_42_15]|uniref:Lipoprotein SmpA/OmlA domain-containing protein n=1 Tax=Candidatus Aquitaenariimonas noxiae TaxID=1974741 RepID=A0A2J0L3Z6_9BACT|nr:MAG: hypothetical protein COS99_06485 [Candidatus Omnitrophica bacterium CG07_land_8_20_14_0_80_42_15]
MTKVLVVFCILSIFLVGCAGIEPPTPEQVINNPLGTDPLRVGMTKDEVVSIWGKPDVVNQAGLSKGLGGTKKEEWAYYPEYSNVPIPVSKGYMKKTKYLYFDGNNLVQIHE